MARPIHRTAAALAALLAAGLTLGGAAAQETARHHRVLHHRPAHHEVVGRAPRYYPGTEPYSVQGQIERGCIPWCNNDTNPCDPPNFKQADGRCSFDNQF